MTHLRNNILILPLLSFILGILLSYWLNYEWVLISISVVLICLLTLLNRNIAFLFFIPVGIFLSMGNHSDELINFTGKKLDIEGYLYRSPESSLNGSRIYVNVNSVTIDDHTEHVDGRVVLYSKERIFGLYHGENVRVMNLKLHRFDQVSNPGGFDIAAYYSRNGITVKGFIDNRRKIISLGSSGPLGYFLNLVDSLRKGFASYVINNFNHPENEILLAMTIGEKGAIPSELRELFSETGIAHLLAISGLHVGAIAFIFYFLIKWVLKRSEYVLITFQVPRLAAFLTLTPVILYSFIAGLSTPVVRASIMASVFLLSVVINRGESKFNTLAFAALIILIFKPRSIFGLSFQLSFLAVFSLILVHRYYPFKFNSIEDKFISCLKSTVVASLATLPLIANTFGILSLAAVPTNLVLIPVVEFLIVPIGLFSFLSYMIEPDIAFIFIQLDIYLIEFTIKIAEVIVNLHYSYFTIPKINTLTWLFYYISGLTFLTRKSYSSLKYVSFAFLLIFCLSIACFGIFNRSHGRLEVNFLSFKKRTLVFCKLPDGKTIVLNGGAKSKQKSGFAEKQILAPFLLKNGITSIDHYILLTVDSNHLEGSRYILKRFNVRNFWTYGPKLSGAVWHQIKRKGIKWNNIRDGTGQLLLGGVILEFLKPEISKYSNHEVITMSYGKINFFMAGGLGNNINIKAFFDKYGDRIVNSEVVYMEGVRIGKDGYQILEIISPKVFITGNYNGDIPFGGENLYLQLDNSGAVKLITDGKHMEISTYKGLKEQIRL
ncbi:MAG: ComEC/Rec2 family competence protein [Thermodesulfobacteriota bacterium]